MIDTATQDVYYTPVYYVLAQFSRTIRPGDLALQTMKSAPELDADALHACATKGADGTVSVQLLNTTDAEISYNLQLPGQYAEILIPANAVQTIRIPL